MTATATVATAVTVRRPPGVRASTVLATVALIVITAFVLLPIAVIVFTAFKPIAMASSNESPAFRSSATIFSRLAISLGAGGRR